MKISSFYTTTKEERTDVEIKLGKGMEHLCQVGVHSLHCFRFLMARSSGRGKGRWKKRWSLEKSKRGLEKLLQ